MDEIRLKGLNVYAYHGVEGKEKRQGQNFYIDITLFTDTRTPGLSDDLNQTVNYADLAVFVERVFTDKYYDLIEAAAENLAMSILREFNTVAGIRLELHKPEAPIPIPFDNVSICITRGWHEAFIAVGSNIGESENLINEAVGKIAANENFKDLVKSSLIVTKPYGVVDQPDFLNGMIKVDTLLTPYELLKFLNEIEAEAGRERLIHWGPRTLDLDIIYYDDYVIRSEKLTVPHIDMCNRRFVLEPLKEVDPYKQHPVNHMTAEEMLNNLPTT